MLGYEPGGITTVVEPGTITDKPYPEAGPGKPDGNGGTGVSEAFGPDSPDNGDPDKVTVGVKGTTVVSDSDDPGMTSVAD